jgi:hypothetical protein
MRHCARRIPSFDVEREERHCRPGASHLREPSIRGSTAFMSRLSYRQFESCGIVFTLYTTLRLHGKGIARAGIKQIPVSQSKLP